VTVAWSVVWTLGTADTDQQLVNMAREGERLLVALHGNPPAESAMNLQPGGTAAQFSTWTDRYSDAAALVNGMPLSVLFAGVSGWDVRSDAVIQALTSSTPPTWAALRADAARRTLPAASAPAAPSVAASFDWFASADEPLDSGNDLQQFASKAHRAWWSQQLQQYPLRPAGTPPVVNPPPVRRGGSGGLFFAFLGILVASRRRKRRG
jgi:subtilisin family serine protease